MIGLREAADVIGPAAVVSPRGALAVTFFENLESKTAHVRTMPWGDLVEMIQSPDTWPNKSAMPLVKLATFGDSRSTRDALRHDQNLREITGIEGDYDGGTVALEDATKRLERAGVRAVLYTTPSHRPEAPRWRVLAPLAAPHPPSARAALVARLNGALGGILASESFTLSQAFYVGRIDGHQYDVAVTFDDPDDGACVDELDDLDQLAIGRSTPPDPPPYGAHQAVRHVSPWQEAADKVKALGRKLRTKDGRREMLKSYIASRSVRGIGLPEMRALVDAFAQAFFDPADPYDQENIGEIEKYFNQRDRARERRGAELAAAILPPPGNPVDPAGSLSVPAAAEPAPAQESITYVSLVDVDENPPPPREWVVRDWLPRSTVTGLWAGGGFGKSLLAQQIATCITNGIPVLGSEVAMGPVVGVFCEDDTDELRRRQKSILASMGRTSRFSTEGLYLASRAGHDNVMMMPIPFSPLMNATPFAWEIVNECLRVRPALLIIDNIAQVYAGIENDRSHTTQFANWLTYVAMKVRCAVLLLGHVAKADGSEYSGSTAWDAALRSRLWLERHDNGTMELHRRKANYTSRTSAMLEFRDGVIQEVAQGSNGAAETLLAAQAEQDVLAALDALTTRQVATSQNPTASTYLPRLATKAKLLNGTNMVAAGRALGTLIDRGDIVTSVELGWKKADRHNAIGLARKAAS